MRVRWTLVLALLWVPGIGFAQEGGDELGAVEPGSDSDADTDTDTEAHTDTEADTDPDSDTIRLRVRTDTPGYALARFTESSYRSNPLAVAVVDLYERVCLAPCETTLPAGEYRLAVEDDGKHYPVGLRALEEDSDLYLAIDRPRAQRAFGTLMVLAGLAAAFVFFGRVVVHKDDDEWHDSFARDVALGSVGAAVFLGGVITLVAAETRARIRIGPRE